MRRLLSILVCLALFLSSCFISRQELQEMIPPLECALWVRYLPETDTEAQFRMSVRPVPMDNGWTDLRMNRDLDRITACGIQVLMLEVTPQQLADAEFLEQFRHFCELAGKRKRQVVLSLIAVEDAPQRLDRRNLSQYLAELDLGGLPVYLQEDARPAFLVAEEFALEDANPEVPEAVAILRFGVEIPPCPVTPVEDTIPLPARFQWLRAAQFLQENPKSPDNTGWIVKRRQGKSLSKQFVLLRQTQCEIALLSSWNDYADGSFIENNSLDGGDMIHAVKMH